ncbi:unnamed protein product (macronuclear) [Paramecium tetraurelia]|uniref:Tubulin beta chain n=1 Tax=Paramecium tetraurelia TaxID=5888 RepID=Q3SEG7_PARTE|nr:uncharacterized protein GSPATT00001668001 [Paramecium tetraurelia]CAI38957.1 theta tubuline, putative [Paramecium tetraurelia]CAK78627.1 unnamed protein product [Paramecium tetraurelia]|eukprot:XP_001446024.1 hypothetical protein (macronuclear) [Paramecium tetraurelia strain d4-2]
MSELIQLNAGWNSNEISLKYLEKLIQDHHLSQQQMNNRENKDQFFERISTCFEEHEKYRSFRGVFLDEQQSMDQILTMQDQGFIDPNYMIGKNVYLDGTYYQGKNIFAQVYQQEFEDKLRQIYENSDQLFGCNLIHSLSDKFCGISMQLMPSLESQLFFSSTSIFPNLQSCSAIEIYNTILSLNQLIFNCNYCMVYDYNSLSKRVQEQYKYPTQSNCHDIIAETLLQNNCSMRFPGYQNGDLRKLAVNLISFPRMHFLSNAFCVISPSKILSNQIYKLTEPANQNFTFSEDAKNFYRMQATVSRTKNLYYEIQESTSKCKNTTAWVKDGFCNINCKVEHYELGDTVLYIGHHNYFGMYCRELCLKFLQQWRRKAYFHYYASEGADELDFVEAESSVSDLFSEYISYDITDQESNGLD